MPSSEEISRSIEIIDATYFSETMFCFVLPSCSYSSSSFDYFHDTADSLIYQRISSVMKIIERTR